MTKYSLFLDNFSPSGNIPTNQRRPTFTIISRDKDEAATRIANLLNRTGENNYTPAEIEKKLREE